MRSPTTDRLPLSVAIVCKDAERTLRACLRSVRFAGEVVAVVDQGSTDGTLEICRRHADKVFVEPWRGHVGQKNLALERCTLPWVLSVDADEVVSPDLAASIQALVEGRDPRSTDLAGFTVDRLNWYLGRYLRHGDQHPDRAIRLFKMELGRWAGVDPHDRCVVDGPVARLDGPLLHHPYRDLADHLDRIRSYTGIAAARAMEAGTGRPVAGMLVSAPFAFFRSYILRAGFLDGRAGLVAATMGAFYVFLRSARLREARLASRAWPNPGE